MIELMSESTGRMLAVKTTGTLTDKDYTDVWIPALQKIIDEFEFANVLLYMDDNFKGWEMKAMWEDVKFGHKHRKDIAKIAIVGGPAWLKWGITLGEMMIDSEIKTYEPEEIQKALVWAAQTVKCACDD
ncbi:MAG: STAS/SEC14 domain-containing protein [Pseudodesulfovibrio sp.]|nr:STAS/SEC14 domain-containing protein [Pseudodesulfovibrio sp.]